jgi:hypothetical protein
MRRISKVVASSARGTALNKSSRTAAVFARGYAAPETPQTDFKVTDAGIRVYAVRLSPSAPCGSPPAIPSLA